MNPLYLAGHKWPCKGCGCNMAPGYDIDQTGQVVSCVNCAALAKKTHLYGLDQQYCWCEPSLTYRNPKTGEETWIHKPLQ